MAQDRDVLAWQRRMAAFMTASIIVAAVFFAVVSIWQYSRFEATFSRPAAALEDPWAGLPGPAASSEQRFEVANARAAYALERELVGRRYDQANLTLTTRLWTRLMGFITGMILALVGAAFVLGKLSEEPSEASTKSGVPGLEWSLSVRSASPGVLLAIMGTLLMALSITIQASYSAEDQAIYFNRSNVARAPPAPTDAIGPASADALKRMIKPPSKPAGD